MRDRLHRVASRLAIIGGLVQVLVALSILFLPVLGTCEPQDRDIFCHRDSYLQLGGNTLGYAFLTLMIVMGVLAVASSRDPNPSRAFMTRWLTVLASAVVIVIAGWGFGFAFAPGGLLLLLAAVLSA